jgi:hypothetical protein
MSLLSWMVHGLKFVSFRLEGLGYVSVEQCFPGMLKALDSISRIANKHILLVGTVSCGHIPGAREPGKLLYSSTHCCSK